MVKGVTLFPLVETVSLSCLLRHSVLVSVWALAPMSSEPSQASLSSASHVDPGPASHQPVDTCPSLDSAWSEFFETNRRTVTRDDFLRCLNELVKKENLPPGFITITEDFALVRSATGEEYKLFFASTRSSARPAHRYWRHRTEIAPSVRNLPLSGARIAIDPGHIGGSWAAREGRLFHGKCGTRIAEGDMNLEVAQVLKTMLNQAGARATLTRENSQPRNGQDSSIFHDRARRNLKSASLPVTPITLAREADRLLLQVAEIESRSKIVNEKIKPDMVICLHFNAEPWGSGSSPQMSKKNHLHVLVGGSYLADELSESPARLDLLRRVVEGTHIVELPLARSIARHLASETGLPPFSYGETSRIATADPASPFVWKRNLMATRTFHCPVIYPEPFVMNNLDTITAVAAASGQTWCRASTKQDIFGQYARAVYKGIVEYWSSRLPRSPSTTRPVFKHNLPSSPYAPKWLD